MTTKRLDVHPAVRRIMSRAVARAAAAADRDSIPFPYWRSMWPRRSMAPHPMLAALGL